MPLLFRFCLTILLACGPVLLLRAQGWSVILPDSIAWEPGFRSVVLPDGRIWFSGHHGHNGLIYNNILLSPAGQVLSHFNFRDSLRHTGLLALPDGNFIVAGCKGSALPGEALNGHPFFMKVDGSLNTIWFRELPDYIYENYLWDILMEPTVDGGFLAGINYAVTGGQNLLKFNDFGAVQWQRPYPGGKVTVSNQGDGVIYMGRNDVWPNYNAFALKLGLWTGDTLWRSDLPSDFANANYEITRRPDGNGYVFLSAFGLQFLNEDGAWTGEKDLYPAYYFAPQRIVAMPDSGFVLTGNSLSKYFSGRVMLRFEKDMRLRWARTGYPHDYLNDVRQTPDGGWLLTGDKYTGALENEVIIKTDSLGNFFNVLLQCHIFDDQNLNCLPDAGEPPLSDVVLEIIQQGTVTYGNSQADGQANVPLNALGDFAVVLHPPGPYWQACTDTLHFSMSSPGAVSLEAPMQSLADCSALTVSVGTPQLRRCFPTTYFVNYCNRGVIPASDPEIALDLDPGLTFLAAIPPPSTVIGNRLIFKPGALQPGECRTLQVGAEVGCDSVVLGQTLCVEATIRPDSFCLPAQGWTGANVELRVRCNGDSTVDFTIKNSGTAPTTTGLEYIVIEDQVVLMKSGFSLPPEDSLTISRPADGQFLRLQADQEPNNPGSSMPSVWAEGCGGFNTLGMVNQFPIDEGRRTADRDCREVTGSYDPNDKRAFPVGFSPEHFIEPNTDLTYLIRFQNTGTDTAFRLEIRDTLPPELDPTSFRAGPSSHPHFWEIMDDGTLKLLFQNILLPDSGHNEAASHGFVQFRIGQKRDLPPGSVIENRAAIFFDFNNPVVTTATLHKIGLDFITVETESPQEAAPVIEIAPNPLAESAVFKLLHPSSGGPSLFSLLDAGGRTVRRVFFSGEHFEFQRSGLDDGIYFFSIENGGTIYASGKIILR